MENFNRWYMPGELGQEQVEGAGRQPDLSNPSPFRGRYVLWGTLWGNWNGAGGDYVAGGQGWYGIVPTDKYFFDHPEYFSLVDGVRLPSSPQSGQLCISNPAVLDLFIACVDKFFQDDPDDVFPLSPNDNRDFCECRDCMAMRGSGNLTDYLVTFYNRVAERLKEKWPDRKLSFLAYWDYVEPPSQIKLHRNLIPQFARIDRTGYPMSADTERMLRAWSAISETVATYEAFGDYREYGFRPCIGRIAHDVWLYRDAGVDIVAGEIHAHWATQGLEIWLWAQMLDEPPTSEPESYNYAATLVEDYCKGMYHAGAEPMLLFYGGIENDAPIDTKAKLAGLKRQWRKAVRLCVNDNRALERLALIGVGLDYTERALREDWQGCIDLVEKYAGSEPEPFQSELVVMRLERMVEKQKATDYN